MPPLVKNRFIAKKYKKARHMTGLFVLVGKR
jgi:hypothetical protein